MHVPFQFLLRFFACVRRIGNVFRDIGVLIQRPKVIKVFDKLMT